MPNSGHMKNSYPVTRHLASGSRKFRLLLMSLTALFCVEFLAACVPVLVATATVTAINVATDRRTLGRNIDDNTLELELRKDYRLSSELQGTNVTIQSGQSQCSESSHRRR